MLLPRVLTAIIGIPLVFVVIYAGGLPFYLFISFVIAMSLIEYSTMLKSNLRPIDDLSLMLMGMVFPLVFYLNGAGYSDIYNFLPFFISLGFIIPFAFELFRKEKYLERISYTVIGVFFISYNISHLISLRELKPYGMKLLILTLVCVWVMDSVAYFIGSKFGKNKLNDISPKKTVEGFVAAVVSAVLFFYLASKFFDFLNLKNFLTLGIIISISGQFSDLAESLIKRACGVKDSSNLLPGHGGFFDRFDSYIFVAPIVYYWVIFVNR
ncbi:MAG: phosphatidate cytidylyltransferase [Elusimicrobiales bacterium]